MVVAAWPHPLRGPEAGGRPITWISLACELQSARARDETEEKLVQIVFTERLLKE